MTIQELNTHDLQVLNTARSSNGQQPFGADRFAFGKLHNNGNSISSDADISSRSAMSLWPNAFALAKRCSMLTDTEIPSILWARSNTGHMASIRQSFSIAIVLGIPNAKTALVFRFFWGRTKFSKNILCRSKEPHRTDRGFLVPFQLYRKGLLPKSPTDFLWEIVTDEKHPALLLSTINVYESKSISRNQFCCWCSCLAVRQWNLPNLLQMLHAFILRFHIFVSPSKIFYLSVFVSESMYSVFICFPFSCTIVVLERSAECLKSNMKLFCKKKKIIRKNEITANACWVKERTNTTNESCIKNFCSLFSVRRLGSHRHCIRKKPEKFHVDTHQSHLFHSLAEDQSKAKLKMHSIFFVFLV